MKFVYAVCYQRTLDYDVLPRRANQEIILGLFPQAVARFNAKLGFSVRDILIMFIIILLFAVAILRH